MRQFLGTVDGQLLVQGDGSTLRLLPRPRWGCFSLMMPDLIEWQEWRNQFRPVNDSFQP